MAGSAKDPSGSPPASGEIDLGAIRDLVDRACHPAPEDVERLPEVERRLRSTLMRLDRESVGAARELVDRLERDGPSRWFWVPLLGAEEDRRRGRWDRALARLDRAASRTDDPAAGGRIAWSRAHVLVALDRPGEAADAGLDAWRARPPELQDARMLAVAALRAGNERVLRRALDHGFALDPEDGILQRVAGAARHRDARALRSRIPEPLARMVEAWRRSPDRVQADGLSRKWQQLLLMLCWNPGDRAWLRLARRWLAEGAEEGGRDAIARAVALEAARNGDWPIAARALGISGSSPVEILERLGVGAGPVALFEAWSALSRGDAETALRRSLESLAPDAPVPAVALRAFESGLPVRDVDVPDLVSRLERSVARSDPLPAATRPALAAIHGAWRFLPHAIEQAGTLGGGNEDPSRARALAWLEAAHRSIARGDRDGAIEQILRATTAWAAWLADLASAEAFARERLAVYRVQRDGREPIDAARLLRRTFENAIRPLRKSLGIGSGTWDALWQLEIAGAALLHRLGGLGSGSGVRALGPVGVGLADLRTELERLLARLRSRSGSSLDTIHTVREVLLGDGADLEGAAPEDSEEVEEVRRLFSLYGPAWVLLRTGQLEAAQGYLESIERPKDDLSLFHRRARDALRCLRREDRPAEGEALERRAVIAAMHEQAIRSIVATAPIDLERLEVEILRALESDAGSVESSRDRLFSAICQIGVGRCLVLWRERGREQRRSHATDRRSNARRQEEGLDLLRLVWRLTRHARVQGSLCFHLDQRAVIAANRGDLDLATELLIEALSVKPNDPRVLRHLPHVVIGGLEQAADGDPESGVEAFERTCRLLGEIGSERDDALRELVEELRGWSITPYLARAGKALAEEDLRTATRLARCCLRLDSGSSRLPELLVPLLEHLRTHPDPRLADEARRLEDLAPDGATWVASLEASRSDEDRKLRAIELNAEAVKAANRQRFPEAIDRITQAAELEPDDETIAANRLAIARAWLSNAREEGDLREFLANPVSREIMKDV